MKPASPIIAAPLFVLLAVVLSSCGSITRIERDAYTKITRDTTITTRVTNAPGERDNGVVFPSTTTEVRDRNVRRYDSLAIREYPAFIRLGFFEGVSTIGSAYSGSDGTRHGTFGLFENINTLLFGRQDDTTKQLFDGHFYRIGIAEWKLPIFNNSPDWTWGVTGYEDLNADADHSLTGMGVLTVTKRFYYRNRIPYMSIRPSLSFSAFPSQYVNASVSADLGSIGGLNLRAYVGYAFGGKFASTGRGKNRTFGYESIDFPYFGIGMSALDFVNREEELQTEWKHHEHSAWEIGAFDFMFVTSDADRSFFAPFQSGTDAPFIKGGTLRIANADLALPVLKYKLSVGTSLFNALVLGSSAYAIGVLPIRVTYHWLPFKRDLQINPFIEVGYAPSTFAHVGVRTMLPISEQMNIQVVAGYVQGNTGSSIPGLENMGYSFAFDRNNNLTAADPNFRAFYIGVGASLYDRLFHSDELRYGKGYPHE